MSSAERTSGKAKLGNDWTFKIYFDPEEDKPSGPSHKFEDEDLINELKRLVDADEKIGRPNVYKVPLINKQPTQLLLYHNFVLFQTRDWWWTIEMNSAGITIQRSKTQEAIKDYFRRKKRNSGMQVKNEDDGEKCVGDLIEWLYKEMN